jgi:hypothetical protein
MKWPTLTQVLAQAERLPVPDQIQLIEHLSQRLVEVELTPTFTRICF